MSLHAAFARSLGELVLEVAIAAPAGEVTVVVGPNGAGKTTLLRVLAGTLAVDSGSVSLADRVLDAPPRTFVPPEQRRMGVVHQDHLLFAHLSALDNVAFGPRCAGAPAARARAVAQGWLDRLGVGAQSSLRPAALSGGQAQRVALARALASAPEALLLDEPLAALDASTRSEVRRDLRAHLSGFAGPVVLVTHDPLDAFTLADRIVVLEDGRVTQHGTLAEVTARPRSDYLADLQGVNLVRGTAAGGVFTTTTTTGATLHLATHHTGAMLATVPPSAVQLSAPPTPGAAGELRPGPAPGSPGGWLAAVEDLEVVGERARVRLGAPEGLAAEVPLAGAVALGLAPGVAVWAEVDATAVHLYPAEGDAEPAPHGGTLRHN